MKKHGCHNKPDRKESRQVQDGWKEDGGRKLRRIVDPTSKGCRYDLRPTDPACDGCRHRHEGE